MSETWHKEYLRQLTMLPMQQVESLYKLSQFRGWPNAAGLNELASEHQVAQVPKFVCQSQLAETDDYYEQIIFQQNIVPTRPNSWHDLFNGLIWLQFPQTKSLLNKLHIEDIQKFGLTPRTPRRNRITHFDECGVIVTYEKTPQNVGLAQGLLSDLKLHQWQKVFVQHREMWGQQLNTFMFGHANLEMLLAPFIGLTGKWLAVEVEQGFSALPLKQQLTHVDEKLATMIIQQQLFSQQKPLSPLPLLGIPALWDANKDPSFYLNTDYFRPASSSLK